MKMFSSRVGKWNLMFHGQGFISDVQQTGPRGADKFYSSNWFMGMAEHDVGRGAFTIRAMLSAEPATITQREFPELFQTGETAFGKALVDGQHPHDLFMELSVAYAHPLGEKTNVEIYFAPVGDPALGPVGFPHRISAAELPQAPLGHHLQDSSHIANEVLTVALRKQYWGAELSGYHGAEPNENRWNIDAGGIDSWSARLSWTPTANWSAQASAGRFAQARSAGAGRSTSLNCFGDVQPSIDARRLGDERDLGTRSQDSYEAKSEFVFAGIGSVDFARRITLPDARNWWTATNYLRISRRLNNIWRRRWARCFA